MIVQVTKQTNSAIRLYADFLADGSQDGVFERFPHFGVGDLIKASSA